LRRKWIIALTRYWSAASFSAHLQATKSGEQAVEDTLVAYEAWSQRDAHSMADFYYESNAMVSHSYRRPAHAPANPC
jgi:hypothetical protein